MACRRQAAQLDEVMKFLIFGRVQSSFRGVVRSLYSLKYQIPDDRMKLPGRVFVSRIRQQN